MTTLPPPDKQLLVANHYQALIDKVPDGLGIQHEEQGRFILDFFNEAWCRAHHFSPAYAHELLQKNTQDFIYPPDLENVKKEFIQVNTGTKQEGHSVYRIYGEDQKLHWIEINYRSAYEENGICYYYASYVNLDAQKEAEAKLREYRLQEKENEINKYRQSVQDLLAANPNSLSSFYFNLTRNTVTPELGRSSYIIKLLTDPTLDGLVAKFIRNIPHAAQQKMVSNILGRKQMLANFKKGLTRSSFDCQWKDEEGNYIWVRTYGNLFQNPVTQDIEGIGYTENIDRDKNWELIVDELVGVDYDFVSLLDLRTKKVTEYSNKGRSYFSGTNISNADYMTAMVDAVNNFIRKDKIEEAIKAHSIDAITAALKEKHVYSLFFPTNDGREEGWRISYLKGCSSKVLIARKDITMIRAEEKKHVRELQKAMQAAEIANAAKTDFLSRMSHDIRTPINGIIGMTYLTQELDLPQEARDNLANIEASSQFLLSLINDVLDMSKAESGRIELHPEPYAPDEFKGYIDSIIKPLCTRRNQLLSFEFPVLVTDLIPLLDKLRINQIVFNLLSNASKYTPEGGKIVYRVQEIKLPGNRMHMHIDIIDNGIGMSEAFQKTIFEPFSRENREYIKEMQGTGLGMTIVKNLVEAMQGTIAVESKIDAGSAFRIDFDVACISAADYYASKAKATRHDAGAKVELAGRHVLVCDDHPLNRKIINVLLQKQGLIVTDAENGQEGVKFFANAPLNYFDVVLMDIRMPVMDGYEATKTIRTLDRSDAATVSIIGLSANAFAEDIEKAKIAGMNDYLAKPVQPQALYAMLKKHLQ